MPDTRRQAEPVTIRLAAAYGALIALAAFGLFSNLDDRLLWGDEAETAVLAVNITRFGVPRVDDGRNIIANLRGAADSNDAGIWTWSPWLDEYLTAGSFLVFGPSTLSARMPFAAAALASALLLARLAFRCTRRHEIALIALALYATCVPLLLHARQARYYAVLALAQLWLMHGLSRVLKPGPGASSPSEGTDAATARAESRDSIIGALHISLALAVLFYCNYIAVPANLAALAGVGAAVWHRTRRPPVALAAAGFGFAALATPWLAYSAPSGQLGSLGFGHFWSSLAYYAGEIHFHLVPWVVLALPVAAFAMQRLGGEKLRRGASNASESDLSARSEGSELPARSARSELPAGLELFIWLLLVASLLVYSLSPLRFFRYLMPLVPPLVLLSAVLIVRHIRPRWARAALVAALVSSNGIAIAAAPLGSLHRFESPYASFTRSITSEYNERLGDVLAFLEEHAEAGQTIWVADPEFPLMFYTELRIIDARYHPFPEEPPEWVFGTSASGVANRRPLEVPAGVRTLYRETPLEVRRSRRSGNIPNPHAHAWFEVAASESELMPIYRKR